jgi:hypothetical protein
MATISHSAAGVGATPYTAIMIGSMTRLALKAIVSVTIAENGIRIRGNDMFRMIDPRLSTDCIETTDPTMTS